MLFLYRTPKELLHEILLVDDKSDKEHLGSQLDEYVKENFDPSLVKIVRQEKRQGLMRSRMTGMCFDFTNFYFTEFDLMNFNFTIFVFQE